MTNDVKEEIRATALGLGFVAAGFASPGADRNTAQDLRGYLDEGRHGEMAWMDTPIRADPLSLWDKARSVIVLAENYAPLGDPLAGLAHLDRGAVSVHAWGRDYHDTIRKRLRTLARFVEDRLGGEVKLFVDTAPVMEKPLAARAGLGWQGRHTNLISPRHGCWLFLGVLFTTMDIEPDARTRSQCGRCHACETACPTGALANGRIDARRCLSYLTIEHKGVIPERMRTAMGNRIYGCDTCLAACPWNRFACPAEDAAFAPRPGIASAPLAELAVLDDTAFRARFSASPIKRIGRDRLLRNVMIAIGNSGLETLAPLARARLDDPCEMVKDAAAWATSRLLSAASRRR